MLKRHAGWHAGADTYITVYSCCSCPCCLETLLWHVTCALLMEQGYIVAYLPRSSCLYCADTTRFCWIRLFHRLMFMFNWLLYSSSCGELQHRPGSQSLYCLVLVFFSALNYPAPGRGTGYCFRTISFFLSLFLCQQHYEKTAGPICMKFSGNVCSDHGTTCLNFGSIRINGTAGQRSIFLLSQAIHVAQRTGVNKSVSFARWQQGWGLLCLAPQLVIFTVHVRFSLSYYHIRRDISCMYTDFHCLFQRSVVSSNAKRLQSLQITTLKYQGPSAAQLLPMLPLLPLTPATTCLPLRSRR